MNGEDLAEAMRLSAKYMKRSPNPTDYETMTPSLRHAIQFYDPDLYEEMFPDCYCPAEIADPK